MNITFLIGNGFDLNAGLRTQYRQFLEFYCSDGCPHKHAAGNGADAASLLNMGVIKQFIELIQYDMEYWSDFEAALGKETVARPLDQQESFDLCLADFTKEFNDYLKREIERFDFKGSLPAASQAFQNDLIGHMDKLRPNFNKALRAGFAGKLEQDRLYRFISFNYTPVLDRVRDSIHNVNKPESGSIITHKFGEIIHIHGRINSSMIMGVNDESQIANRFLASQPLFRSSIVKPVVNQESGRGVDSAAEQLIHSSNEICIFGMSIGATDACWWQLIGKWLSADKSHQVILFDRGHDILDIYLPEFNRRQAALQTHFLSQCFPNDDAARKSAKKQVFVALKSGMFADVVLREKPSFPANP